MQFCSVYSDVKDCNFVTILLVTVLFCTISKGEACPSQCECTDLTVDCSARNLVEVPKGIPDNVTTLLLNNNDICSIDGNEFEYLTSLRFLHLSYNCLTEFPTSTLHNTSDLQELHLDSNKLSHIEENTFYSVQELQELNLSNNSLQFIPELLFSQSLNLNKLFLQYNLLDEEVFKSLQHAVFLQQIQLQQNQIQKLVYKILPAAFRLESLELKQNAISEIDSNSFIGMETVQYLDLSENGIDTVKREIFHPLSGLAGLDLAQNPLVCSCDTKKLQDWISEEPVSLTNPVNCYDPIFNNVIDIESGDLDYLCNETVSTGPCNAPCASGATVAMELTSESGNMASLSWEYKLISDSALTQIDCKALGDEDKGFSIVIPINTTAILIENLESEEVYTCCMLIYKCDLYTCDALTIQDPVLSPCDYIFYIISIAILSLLLIVLLVAFIVFVLKTNKGLSSQKSEKSVVESCSPRTSATVVSMDSSFTSAIGTNGFQLTPMAPLRKRPLPNPNRESTYEHIPLDFEQSGNYDRNLKNIDGVAPACSQDLLLEKSSENKDTSHPHKEVVISETQNITSTYLTPVDSKENIPRKPRRFVRPSKLNHKSKDVHGNNTMIKSTSLEGLNTTSNPYCVTSSIKTMKENLTDPTKDQQTSSDGRLNSPNKLTSFKNIRSTCPENILSEGMYGAGFYQEITTDK